MGETTRPALFGRPPNTGRRDRDRITLDFGVGADPLDQRAPTSRRPVSVKNEIYRRDPKSMDTTTRSPTLLLKLSGLFLLRYAHRAFR